MTAFFDYLTNQDGATAIEYALISVLVAVGAIAGLQSLGSTVVQSYEATAAAFPAN